jgi:LacI family transcriptional regulator
VARQQEGLEEVNGVSRTRRVTLSDVATRAGVSTTTASYILNGRSDEMRISTATQDRVRRAADELSYRPNPSARNLRTSTTRTVGLISDQVAGGQFASQMITGASAAARQQDHFVLIGESQGDPELEALLVAQMLDQRVDGIVYATVITSDVDLPDVLRDQRAVLLNCFDHSSPWPAVVPDDYQGGRSAVEALVGGEFRDSVHVVGDRPVAGGTAAGLRLDGIRDALQAAGSDLRSEVACDWNVRDAFAAVSGFLDGGGRPDALVCMNDRIAMGTYQALAAHGLSVPGDVSVVSFDGSDLGTWLRPQVTSVVLPYAEMGARAVDILLGEPSLEVGVERVPMPVLHGESVATSGD